MPPIVRYLLTGLVVLAALVFVVIGLNSGYGEVSSEGYEYAKALYSACNLRNSEKLDKISTMIAEARERGELSDRESKWLNEIIAQARSSNWEAAQQSTRRLMEDQVKS